MQSAEDISSPGTGRKVLRWMGRIAGAIVALLVVAAILAATREFFAQREDHKRFPRQGQKVDLGGYSLNLNCTGEGSPTVILESGWSMPGVGWSLVQPDVARFARVCSYDRAGYGWSDEGPMPRTSDEIARELHALLHNAGVKPPYVFAGHSLGGYIIRCFRGMYPNEVVGMVLVDSSQEDMIPLMSKELLRRVSGQIDQLKKTAPFFPLLARLGIIRRLMHEQAKDYKLTPDLLEEVTYLSAQPKVLRAMVSELDAATDNNQDPQQVRQYGADPGTLGNMPLIVLTAGSTPPDPSIQGYDEFMKVFVTDLQVRLAHLSTRGKQIVVDSSHFMPFEKPQVVITAIREVHDAAAGVH
jgi:pimeloyl-ACP methyl ester carboxylesterase